ncbi:hypothetical protein AARAC_001472 [Aspergillus arachidicola]|uniref:Uncharacterized protein n=1 Tax=Aspergillus arachidicola TaxID=656916 RepID=A0A2G7FIP2_9EURO|nr:hypothetical protein AARAC_001472 [Aspergillus arachidicola]
MSSPAEAQCELSPQARAFSSILTGFIGSVITGATHGYFVAFFTGWICLFSPLRLLGVSIWAVSEAIHGNRLEGGDAYHDFWFGAPSTSPATALRWMGWAYRNVYTPMSQVLWLIGNFQKAPGGLKIVKAFGICTTVLPFTIDTQARFGDELEERFGSWSRHLFSLVSAFNCLFLTMLAILLLLIGTIQVDAGWILILHYIIFSVVVTVISFGARLPRDQATGVNTFKDMTKGIAMGCYMSTAIVIPALIVFLQEPDSPGSDVITYIGCEPLALWRKFIAIFP